MRPASVACGPNSTLTTTHRCNYYTCESIKWYWYGFFYHFINGTAATSCMAGRLHYPPPGGRSVGKPELKRTAFKGKSGTSRGQGEVPVRCTILSNSVCPPPPEQHKRAHVHRFFLLKPASSLLIFLVSSVFR